MKTNEFEIKDDISPKILEFAAKIVNSTYSLNEVTPQAINFISISLSFNVEDNETGINKEAKFYFYDGEDRILKAESISFTEYDLPYQIVLYQFPDSLIKVKMEVLDKAGNKAEKTVTITE